MQMEAFTKSRIARHLDIDRRTLAGALKRAKIAPDFIVGKRLLYLPERITELFKKTNK